MGNPNSGFGIGGGGSLSLLTNVLLTHGQEAMMEGSMEVLEALETKAVGLGAKGLAGWEEVGAEEDMGPTLETWVGGALADLVAVLFFSFPTYPRSWPMLPTSSTWWGCMGTWWR